jgi:plastocyanin
VGDIFFTSGHNGSSNPAVDTVAVNGTVTWTWATTENLPHSVQSIGSPSFTSSAIQSGSGKTYSFTFTAPGTYQYDCAVHGQMMTGRIVVLAASASSSSGM